MANGYARAAGNGAACLKAKGTQELLGVERCLSVMVKSYELYSCLSMRINGHIKPTGCGAA